MALVTPVVVGVGTNGPKTDRADSPGFFRRCRACSTNPTGALIWIVCQRVVESTGSLPETADRSPALANVISPPGGDLGGKPELRVQRQIGSVPSPIRQESTLAVCPWPE